MEGGGAVVTDRASNSLGESSGAAVQAGPTEGGLDERGAEVKKREHRKRQGSSGRRSDGESAEH